MNWVAAMGQSASFSASGLVRGTIRSLWGHFWGRFSISFALFFAFGFGRVWLLFWHLEHQLADQIVWIGQFALGLRWPFVGFGYFVTGGAPLFVDRVVFRDRLLCRLERISLL